jgi:hypothetical protein
MMLIAPTAPPTYRLRPPPKAVASAAVLRLFAICHLTALPQAKAVEHF